MKRSALLLLLVPGAVLATLGVGLALLMSLGTAVWTCSCAGGDNWSYVGPDGFEESSAHLDATGHETSCERTDWSAKVLDRVFGFIFPEHEG
jgi:hypothetical protein